MPDRISVIRTALDRLGVHRLIFAIHQSAFPVSASLDSSFGSPYGEAGRALTRFASALGFNGMQLGPDGQISDGNASPYDGTAFARNTLALALDDLRPGRDENGALLGDEDEAALMRLADTLPQSRPGRADVPRARAIMREALGRAHARFAAMKVGADSSDWQRALSAFQQQQADWLEIDALFEVFAEGMGHDDPALLDPGMRALLMPTPDAAIKRRSMRIVMGGPLERLELAQLLAHRQAERFRDYAHSLGMAVFGDLQVGWSRRDFCLRENAFHPRWLLGAPPSRTNPDGQPWGYPLLDPGQLDNIASPARRLLSQRMRMMLTTYDGLRIDHPHGLVCPWIYKAEDSDHLSAVQSGARAFESPTREEPELRAWAIARPEDLNERAEHPWDEDWVSRMDENQVARWSRLLDELMAMVRAQGMEASAISAEVLSTCPAPLRAVLQRHGLGRFRVTQKADVERPNDVYRTDQALPQDWVMLGNHDTLPMLVAAQSFLRDGRAAAKARYLAHRLEPSPAARADAAQGFASSPGALAQAHLADLFTCRAENVLVYFTDLFGESEPFNRPGIVDDDNWTLRLPEDFVGLYRQRLADGRALNVLGAMATALRARGDTSDLPAALIELSKDTGAR